MANLGLIAFKRGLNIKVKVNDGQKMWPNWPSIGTK